MAEENPFLKKKAKPKPKPQPVEEVIAAPAPAKQEEDNSVYDEPADPNENPFAKKKKKKAPSRQASRRDESYGGAGAESSSAAGDDSTASNSAEPDDVVVEVQPKKEDENPFAKFRKNRKQAHSVADSSGGSGGGPRRSGGCSCWECFGFRGAYDSVEAPRGWKACGPKNENPSAAEKAWNAELQKRTALTILFMAVPVLASWGILVYMIATGDDALYNLSLIVPRNSSATGYTILLNCFVTNPAVWWNQFVDTAGFMAIGWMLVFIAGANRIQLPVLLFCILVPMCSLLSLGIELDVQAPVYGNQSVIFGFLGAIFAYVIVIQEGRCKNLTIALVMTGVYFGAYIGVRFAAGAESDPVQWLTPVVSFAITLGVMIGCLCVNEKRVTGVGAGSRKARAVSVKGVEMSDRPFSRATTTTTAMQDNPFRKSSSRSSQSAASTPADSQAGVPKYARNPFRK